MSLDKKEGSDLKNSRTPFNPKNKLVFSDSFNLYEKSMLNSFNLSTKVFLEKILATLKIKIFQKLKKLKKKH